jgi:hypothetical protein
VGPFSIVKVQGDLSQVVPFSIIKWVPFQLTKTENGALVSFYDFENREGIFPGVHRNYNFALTTMTGTAQPQVEAEFAFFMTQIDHLQDDERCFTLTSYDLAIINPNTRTCPIFNTRRDANLTRKFYGVCPVLHNEQTGENPWGVTFFTVFHMANDSHLFRTQEELETEGYTLSGSRFVSDEELYLPLYEAKMMHQFDHRHGTFQDQSSEERRRGLCREFEDHRRIDANVLPIPRYWTTESSLKGALIDGYEYRWFIGFRNITRAVDSRTATFAVLPWAGSGHSIQLVATMVNRQGLVAALLANLNALPFDFVVRQKMGGINLSYYIVRQLPVLPPGRYTLDLLAFIVPRVLELTYTAWDIKAFADDVWREADKPLQAAIMEAWEANVAATGEHVGAQPPAWVETTPDGFPYPPFKWDEERRAHLRAELDALYGHLYGLTREELDYILDTFPIVRRKDEGRYGEYRTKRLVLEAYDKIGAL